VGAHLPGEDLVVAVVVADRGHCRRVRRERDRGQRPPVRTKLPDQLGREMLGLGGAAPVAGDQQPAATAEVAGELGTPTGQPGADRPERIDRRGERAQVFLERVHQATASAGTPATAA
jgi:hypothetical protein